MSSRDTPLCAWATAELAALDAAGRRRQLRHVIAARGPEITVDGRPAINFCGNDYLGLAGHPAVIEAAHDALAAGPAGAGASRLVSGNHAPLTALEAALAAFTGKPAAVVFASGYHANTGWLPALTGAGDAIFSDRLNHRSLIDGCRLSRARVIPFAHNDAGALAAAVRAARPFRHGWILCEGVYSMDGDLAPLADYAALARREGLYLAVDEAHALGVIGPGGRGAVAAAGVLEDVTVYLGTLGKALGAFGAFVACDRALAEVLVNRAGSLLYSTALPPAMAAAATRALGLAAEAEAARARLREMALAVAAAAAARGYGGAAPGAAIVPVILGGAKATMAACEALLDRGVFVQGIRPPTVPEGTARLRITVSAAHESAHLERLLAALGEVLGA